MRNGNISKSLAGKFSVSAAAEEREAKMPKSKGRGRKRKSSPPLESEDATSCAAIETRPAVVPSSSSNNGGGKYIPRFGNAAKKQKLKLHNDSSDDAEERSLCSISCTQPAKKAGPLESEGEGAEWSSTQPAHYPTRQQVNFVHCVCIYACITAFCWFFYTLWSSQFWIDQWEHWSIFYLVSSEVEYLHFQAMREAQHVTWHVPPIRIDAR